MERTTGANYNSSSGYRKFTDGPPGTTVEQTFLNNVQEELCHLIESSAQTLSATDETQAMQTVGMMGFGMRNGKIVPSVAGNALTVAIKTLQGNDPSTLNPVYVRIGDNLRKITSALYITLTGGTDDWDRTSYTYSLFVYLGWDAVNSRVEILLCPQPTYLTYPAANPGAPDPRRLRSAYGSSTGTAITNGHILQVCGRVDDIVQSGADNYTGVTATNVISYPVYYSPLLLSPEVPAKTNAADTTPIFTTNVFEYAILYNYCYINFYFLDDGGVDGAGVAGFLALNLPFLAGTTNNIIAMAGQSVANGYDGANLNYLQVQIGTSADGLVSRPMWIRSGGLVTDIQINQLQPGNYTNGNRQVLGSFIYKIMN